jgi:hypothetical protein
MVDGPCASDIDLNKGQLLEVVAQWSEDAGHSDLVPLEVDEVPDRKVYVPEAAHVIEVPYCSGESRGMLIVELSSKMYHCQLVPRRRLELAVEGAACPHVEQCTSQHDHATFLIELATSSYESHSIAKLLARSKEDGGSAVKNVVVHHTHSDDEFPDFHRNLEESGGRLHSLAKIVACNS